MSARTVLALFVLLPTLLVSQATAAIDKDQVIAPSSKPAAEAAAEESGAMDGIFSGQKASGGALIAFVGYAVIIGAIAVVVWYFFKRGLLRKPFAKGEGKLKVAETRMLGNRQFIMVVEYEEQKILLGVGPGKIDYLTNLHSYRGDFPQIDELAHKVEGGRA